MIGNGYWATGIEVWRTYSGMGQDGWCAEVAYYDDGFCNDEPGTTAISTEGSLRTRYAVRDAEDGRSSLSYVIDVIKADAERLGIRWLAVGAGGPTLYYNPEFDRPEGWPELVAAESARIGWPAPLEAPSAALAEKEQEQ